MTALGAAADHPRRDSAVLRALGRAMLAAARWRIVGAMPRAPKFVVIVAPHTSNWDFYIGVAAMFALDIDVMWLGKDSLFRGPPGRLLRLIGGRPVRRHTSEGMVADIAASLQQEPRFVLALAPEGTRKRVEQWKTGFYRIAEAAAVPIVPVWFDWSRREIGIGAPFEPAGGLSADIATLQSMYDRRMARHPEKYWAGAR